MDEDVDRVRQALVDMQAYGVGAHLCDFDINEQDVIDVIDWLRAELAKRHA